METRTVRHSSSSTTQDYGYWFMYRCVLYLYMKVLMHGIQNTPVTQILAYKTHRLHQY